MSVLTYNGAQLSYWSTQFVDFQPVMDEVSGVDYECTRLIISGTAIIAPGAPPANPGETATAVMARVEHLLNTPRRGFTFTNAGVTLASVADQFGNTTIPLRDARNGPFVKAKVSQIAGTEAISIEFRLEAYIVDCAGTGQVLQYTSHRWTEIADINQLGMTRRTRNGRLSVRADLLGNADQLRGLVIPPLEPDFIRESSRYTLQADGRVLAYEFVDQQQYLMPPSPAAKAEGRFSITSKDGASYFAECYLKLEGGKTTDKTVLMIRAFAIATAKIQSARQPGDNGSYPMFGTLAEDMFANEVTVRLVAQVNPAKARLTTLSGNGTASNGGVSGSGLPGPGPDPNTTSQAGPRPSGTNAGLSTTSNFDWLKVPGSFFDGNNMRFDPGDRGSAQLLLIAAQLQDPCFRLAVLNATGQQATLGSVPGQTRPASIVISSWIPDDTASYRSAPEADGVYEIYTVEIKQTNDPGILSLPVGKKDADAAVLQVAAPIVRKRVEWRAVKIGGPPKVPNPVLKDTNWTLVNNQTNPGKVEPIADGSILRFEVAGCYDYVAKSASKAKLIAAVPPWVDPTAGAAAAAPFVYADNILEPGTGTFQTGGQPF